MRLTLATFALVRKTIPPNDEKLKSELGLNQRPTAQRAVPSTIRALETLLIELGQFNSNTRRVSLSPLRH